ncbi:SDR family oxidoreductase [Pseudomonas sp. R5(2019)]|uniref:SDR family NAD(P)-dependent oxidoreductase n=1 Tax=Pseudomonas sp. R5(2019) TaxID=2697566 RepID=UPI001412DCEC|nr:SDR family NAD(P)-dependent oxidoreductase [Pseudomonas sp. R5(2019)]NBA94949.1 SDR family NAD(P)-dependent oxidoreductase [Pseudomonas sp. R5(2019)]
MSPRRFWLTGASDGIGAALATQLLDQGMQLAVSGGNAGHHAALMQRYPGQVLSLSGNLSEHDAAQRACDQIASTWGSLDAVILNAGTCDYLQDRTLDENVIMRVVQSNQLASTHCTEFAQDLLKTGQQPHLVAIVSSISALPLATSDFTTHHTRLLDMFEARREALAQAGIALTVVGPGVADVGTSLTPDALLPKAWTPEDAARHVLENMQQVPAHIQLPTFSVDTLWPLPGPTPAAFT